MVKSSQSSSCEAVKPLHFHHNDASEKPLSESEEIEGVSTSTMKMTGDRKLRDTNTCIITLLALSMRVHAAYFIGVERSLRLFSSHSRCLKNATLAFVQLRCVVFNIVCDYEFTHQVATCEPAYEAIDVFVFWKTRHMWPSLVASILHASCFHPQPSHPIHSRAKSSKIE